MSASFLFIFYSKLFLMWCYSMRVLALEIYWGFFLFDFSAAIDQHFLTSSLNLPKSCVMNRNNMILC